MWDNLQATLTNKDDRKLGEFAQPISRKLTDKSTMAEDHALPAASRNVALTNQSANLRQSAPQNFGILPPQSHGSGEHDEDTHHGVVKEAEEDLTRK